MYLKQKGLKISGSKAELIDRVLTYARGNLSARDAVLWGISQFRRHKLRVQWFWWLFDIRLRVIWSDFCTGGRNPTTKLGVRESMVGDFFQGKGGGGGSVNIIIVLGGVEITFCLMRGGYYLVLGHISPISQPLLQVVIAQSLTKPIGGYQDQNSVFLFCCSVLLSSSSVLPFPSLTKWRNGKTEYEDSKTAQRNRKTEFWHWEPPIERTFLSSSLSLSLFFRLSCENFI